MLAWLTKSALPSSNREYIISLPDDELWQADFFGAILPLISTESWELHGALTPDEMSEYWLNLLIPQIHNLRIAMPVGSILAYASNIVPEGYLLCNGGTHLIADYPELAALVGNSYGGNGTTTFGVPDLTGKFVMMFSAGHGFATTGGNDFHTLTVAELPVHTHTQNSHNHTQSSHNHTQDSHNHTQNAHAHIFTAFNATPGSGSSGAAAGTRATIDSPTATATNIAATATNQAQTAVNVAATATNQNTGSGNGHNNLPPYLVLSYVIKAS